MNANEVIANRAIELLGGELGSKNAGPSERSRQSRPIVERHVSRPRCTSPRRVEIEHRLLPALKRLHEALDDKAKAFAGIVKIGRTHTAGRDAADARPGILRLRRAGRARHRADRARRCDELMPLAQGGTAVGTGLNAQPRFAETFAAEHRADHRPPFRHARRTSSRRWPRTTRMVVRARRAQHARRLAVQDRQRHPPARLRPARRARRAGPAGERAGLLDHARQGQPDAGRGADHGLHRSVRQPGRGHLRRQPGPPRAQCLQAGDRLRVLQSIRLLADASASFAEQLRRGHRGRRGADRRADRALADAGHRARPGRSATTTPRRSPRTPIATARRCARKRCGSASSTPRPSTGWSTPER